MKRPKKKTRKQKEAELFRDSKRLIDDLNKIPDDHPDIRGTSHDNRL